MENITKDTELLLRDLVYFYRRGDKKQLEQKVLALEFYLGIR